MSVHFLPIYYVILVCMIKSMGKLLLFSSSSFKPIENFQAPDFPIYFPKISASQDFGFTGRPQLKASKLPWIRLPLPSP